jgi:adenylate cyclase
MDIMVQSVEKNSGTVDKFIGDAIMAYWNAPLKVKNHADKAVQTALHQIAQREFLNKKINADFGFDVAGVVGGDDVFQRRGEKDIHFHFQ